MAEARAVKFYTQVGYIKSYQHNKQEALLLQRDLVTRLSVQILQLQNIPFENDCNQQVTLKFILLRSS